MDIMTIEAGKTQIEHSAGCTITAIDNADAGRSIAITARWSDGAEINIKAQRRPGWETSAALSLQGYRELHPPAHTGGA